MTGGDVDFLVTADGRWLVTGSPEANAAIGYEDPDFDAPSFAVRNLGFIQVVFRGPRAVRLRLHPLHVAPGALSAVEDRHASFGGAEIEVVHLADRWVAERFAGFAEARQRLAGLCAGMLREPPAPEVKYSAVPADLQPLFRNDGNPLRLLLQKWRVSFGRFTETLVPFAIQHGIFSRMMIVSVTPQQPDPVVRYMGEGLGILYGDDFPYRAPGEKVADLPHKDYSAWAARFYAQTAERREPRYDLVDATVPNPAAGESEQQRLQYERLLLPWETPSGETLVTLSSKLLKREAEDGLQATAEARAIGANDLAMNSDKSV
jgi:hypothetical protein